MDIIEQPTDNKITGTIEGVAYQNQDTGFTVLDLAVEGDMVTVVGELYGAAEGEELTVWGEYTTHPSFGLQFKAAAFERVLPSSATAIFKYLSGSAIHGVGPVTARRLVDAFGDKTLEIIAKQPEKMANIKGLSEKKAREIAEQFRKIYGVREVIAELSSLGLDTSDALMLYRAFSDVTIEIVKDNPFIMCGYPLYKEFEFADAISRDFGVEPEHINRVRAGIVYILRHNLQNGHTCLPAEKLIDTVYNFIDIARDTVEIVLYDAVDDGLLKMAVIDGEDRIFLSNMFAAERYIAERLMLLKTLEYHSVDDADKLIDEFESFNSIEYESLQRRAIKHSLTGGAVVVTGGPGTGKTTTLNAIIALCEQNGDEVALAAPTGRAAKRLSELTGREAKTIHRLLEVEVQKNDVIKFVHDETNMLKFDVAVIDEMSMVDSALFESLLKGLKPQCRLIMVGDFNQLPSVGAGNVLRNIIDSGICETIEFQKIFRQAAKSLIVVNAHTIVAGDMPDLDARDNDFFFLKTDKENGAALVCSLAAQRLPKAYGLDAISDIQVLTPSRIGMLGSATLNEQLRATINPAREKVNEARIMGQIFREGDRVMQIKNNYDIQWQRDGGEQGVGAFNGDIGTIELIDRKSQIIKVLFDDRTVSYTFEHARQLEPAYAVTVHKSQGSEFPAVVLALCDFSKKLCYRNLLYTAVTRARKLLVVVGDETVFEAMVRNDRKMLRYTGLEAFLTGEA